MAIPISDVTGANTARVEPMFGALVTRLAPQECIGWNTISEQTGLLTGLVAGAGIFSLKNLNARPLLLRRFSLSVLTNTLGTAGRFDFALYVARTWPTNDTGGTDISAACARHRGALVAPNVHARIAGTAALTAGAGRLLDGGKVACAGYWSAAAGSGIAQVNLLSHDTGDHPVVLAQNEGIVLAATAAAAATAAIVGYVAAEFVDVASYP